MQAPHPKTEAIIKHLCLTLFVGGALPQTNQCKRMLQTNCFCLWLSHLAAEGQAPSESVRNRDFPY